MRPRLRHVMRPAHAADRSAMRLQMIGGREAGNALARLEVVVAVLEPEHLDPVRERVAGDLVAGAELVARALADQRRRLQPGEVLGAQLLGLAGGWNG